MQSSGPVVPSAPGVFMIINPPPYGVVAALRVRAGSRGHSNFESITRRRHPLLGKGGVPRSVGVAGSNHLLTNTTPALRATPPQLRRGCRNLANSTIASSTFGNEPLRRWLRGLPPLTWLENATRE